MNTINLTRLYPNVTIKNYKELCSLLNVKEQDGNSKTAQVKEFSQYFSWTKQGHKYIINEIFEEQKEKIDLRTKSFRGRGGIA